MRTLRTSLALVVLGACAPATPRTVPTSADGMTTVIVVRHAEKATEAGADPPLTAAGMARARALSDELRGLPVTAIVSTDFLRTRSTAAPLAARTHVVPELVDVRAPDHARLVAEGVLARHRGETVVVVGHSNTVPDIVAALGATRPPPICDGKYDTLFIVRVPRSGPATVERRTYGVPTEDASCSGSMPGTGLAAAR